MKYGGFVAVSPDGSKVLYSGLEKQVNHVFLYDIVQKQILWKSEGFNWINDLGGIPATTIWTNDGKWAIFAAARKEPYRILFAISADGTVFKELAVLDNKIFEGELRSFQISGDQEYIFFSLWDTLAHINESSAAVAGKGYLLDIEKRVIKTVCLKDQLFFNGVFHRDSFIYNVFNPQSKKVEVWVLKPKLWQTEKLFEFSTDGVYYVLGKNFALR
jgi:Tol biopolymer transport system component